MPTNEERREVARNLRELCGRDYGEAGVPIDEIERALGVNPVLPCSYDPNDVYELADLIDSDECTCCDRISQLDSRVEKIESSLKESREAEISELKAKADFCSLMATLGNATGR